MNNIYKKEQIQQSVKKLNNILPDSDVYNGLLFQKFCNTKVSQDFTKKSLKRINVKKCHFIDCCFKAAAGTGSKFTNVYFDKCNFQGANFQYCYFNKTNFSNETLIKGANFSHGIFIGCDFKNITIEESTLFGCHFENCTFSSSTIRSNTLENSTMYNCIINDIDLAHINLEYLRFVDIHMNQVVLPPYQVAYIIGAPSYIRKTEDKVYIYTDNGNIDTQAYSALFDDLVAYYYSHKEYFPLANIMIAMDKHDIALECIQTGAREAVDYFDFRMVKHFCKLACSNENFTALQLKGLYDTITNLSYNNEWDLNTLHSYLLNIGEIKELLLNNSMNKQRVEFLIKTNIDKDDLSAINELYNEVNNVIRSNCSETHIDSIELRHNSPYELYITCIDVLPNILMCISAMYGVLTVCNKFLDVYKNFEETRRVNQQNKLYKYEKEEKLLDIEIKKLERDEKYKKLKENTLANKSGIYTITEIEHNMKCNTLDMAKSIAPEYLHYKFTKNIPEQ